MSYNSELQANNIDLQDILDTINNLPESGGGDSLELVPTFTYTVTNIDGAPYGFALNDSGYYESQNKGISSSYAICRINIIVGQTGDVEFEVVQSSEGSADYSIYGNIDSPLSLSTAMDADRKGRFSGSTSVRSLIYENVSAGEHFIDVKYTKDSSENKYNDSAQFLLKPSECLSSETVQKIQAVEPNLQPQNIVSGVTILGISGTDPVGGSTTVSGSFIPTNVNLYSNPITINGLGFKPTQVIIVQNDVTLSVGLTGLTSIYVLKSMSAGTLNAGTSVYVLSSSKSISNASLFSIDFNEDGFVLRGTTSQAYISLSQYNYAAIG